ncbi:hypothetical protein DYB32_008413 [Aphanomyces invadans]|uniref:Aldehyde dehydrogenase domain-containing protein n=1 Tax=Aphanomyces invadans TaxID=157072 RepID=A0A3R6WJZ1_9STRA|nr:hypothetical protein DYB32_008413 [Aphanomyces invadans]
MHDCADACRHGRGLLPNAAGTKAAATSVQVAAPGAGAVGDYSLLCKACSNPYTLKTEFEVAQHSSKESADILVRVKKAQREWASVSLDERKAICTKWTDVLNANIDTIATDISRQMGKPLSQAVGEVKGTIQRAKYEQSTVTSRNGRCTLLITPVRIMIGLADRALAPTTSFPTSKDPGLFREISKEPIGVVFVIAPWNYPMMTVVNSVVPALLAGQSFLFIPSISKDITM